MNIYNIENHPFGKFSAEEETKFIEHIFIEPKFYKELLNVIVDGSSRVVVGQRGFGKSATIYSLFQKLPTKNTLPILVNRYDDVPLTNNETYFLCIIIKSITNEIAKYMFCNKKCRKKLDSYQREKLSFFIELFYDSETSSFYIEKTKDIRKKKFLIRLCSLFNKSLKPINAILNGLQNFSSTLLRESIQLSAVNESSEIVKSFLKETDLPTFSNIEWNSLVKLDVKRLKDYLDMLLGISKTIGFNSVAVLFDGIDEYKSVMSDPEKVVGFTKSILDDTELLYRNGLAVVFSLWSEIRSLLLVQGTRFDKFPPIIIEWTNADLEDLIDKRLLFFTQDKKHPVTLKSLVPDDNIRTRLLTLSYKSPRSLITLLNTILYKEEGHSPISFFTQQALDKGIMAFCKEFPYVTLSPYKKDFNIWLNKLLLIKLTQFSIEQMTTALNIKKNTASTYISELKKRGLISSETDYNTGNTIYKVLDPRIEFLIKNDITDLS